MKRVIFLLLVILLISCQGEKRPVVFKNPFDTTKLFIPWEANSTDKLDYSGGCLIYTHLPNEETWQWSKNFKPRNKAFWTNKKKVYKFLSILMAMDSMKIADFDSTWINMFDKKEWVDCYNSQIKYKKVYCFTGLFPTDQICIVKKNKTDSVPLGIDFYADVRGNLKMTLSPDSSIAEKVFELVKMNKLGVEVKN